MNKRAVYLFVTKDFYKLNVIVILMDLKIIYIQRTSYVVVINVIKSDTLL